jgi:hypothetical protein
MGNTRNTGYLQNIVLYDANDNITLPARLAVTGTVSINNTTPYDTTQFSLDVNGGLIVKNINKTAQFVLINSNPASGGNNAFVVHTVGGTSASSYADIQGYYGTSIAGSTVLRLNPQGGNVLVGSLAGTGSRMVVASSTGVLSTQAIVTLGDLSGVSTARTLTINGTTQDLSANRTWTLYTDDISEDGSPVNLWFTNARARAAISVTGSGSYDSATGVITVTGGVTAVNTKTGNVTLTTSDITEGTRLYYTDTRVGTYLTSNNYATQSYVGTQINNLVAGAPGLLDTLDELAAALGDDANFATTTATSLGNRLRIDTAAQGLNSTQQGNGRTNLGLGSLATLSSIGNSYITDLAWSKLSSTPTTISGYGITNAYTDAQIQNFFNGANAISGYNKSNWDTAYGWGNHASAGYLTTSSAASTYLTSATAATTYVSLTGSYANPSWITSLAYSKITGVPAFLTSYTETDTLATVTGRGNTTTDRINVRGIGNQSGGNILMGNLGVNTNKWSYLIGTHYNTTTQPQGVSIIGLYSDLNNNTIVIGGSIYEANPATEIQFWTHNATSHNLGGTKRMTLNSDGNLSITGTVSASNFSGTHSGSSSGTNTGDQTNITGNAGTATLAANSTLWNGLSTPSGFTSTGTVDKLAGGLTGFGDIVWLSQARVQSFLGLGSLAYSSATIPTNTNQLTNGAGYITGYTETDTLASVTGRGSSTSATLTSTNGLGLYVNSGAASYIGINSTSNWSYVSHLNNGSTTWDVGAFNGGQYEIRPYGGSNNRVTVQLNGQFSVNNSQNQVALFQSGNANTWVDIISTGGTWSLGAAGNNRFAIYNRGGSEGTRFEVSTSAAWVNGNTVWHAGNLTNLNQLTNGPGYLTSYTETDTLSSVVVRGNSTAIGITINPNGTSITMGGGGSAEGIRMQASTSTTYPVFLRSVNPSGGGETSPWLYKEESTPWGIWHNNPINTFDFTSAGSGGIAQNVGGGTNQVMVRIDPGAGYVQTAAGFKNSAGTITLDNSGNISGNASTATNVAWTGVTGRPTALSSFTNDLGNYGGWITSSGSISGNAATAGSSNFLFLQSTSNLRTVTSAGIYREEQPDSGFSYTTTLNMNSSDGRQQLTIARGGDGMKFRGTTSGSGDVSWSSWKTVWHSDNLTNLNQLTNGPGYITGVTNISGNAATATSATQVVTIQDGPPSGSAGRLWWESDTGKLKVYYGSAWVDVSPIPDTSLFFSKAGGVITGDVSIGQTLNVVGNTLVQGTIYSFGDVIAYSSSDARLKDNITTIESPLEKLSKINGVSFNWNDKQSIYEIGAKDYGVIAQEVEAVLPELVTTRNNGYKAVRYEKIVSLLIEAIKEQQTQINNLTYKLNNL